MIPASAQLRALRRTPHSAGDGSAGPCSSWAFRPACRALKRTVVVPRMDGHAGEGVYLPQFSSSSVDFRTTQAGGPGTVHSHGTSHFQGTSPVGSSCNPGASADGELTDDNVGNPCFSHRRQLVYWPPPWLPSTPSPM